MEDNIVDAQNGLTQPSLNNPTAKPSLINWESIEKDFSDYEYPTTPDAPLVPAYKGLDMSDGYQPRPSMLGEEISDKQESLEDINNFSGTPSDLTYDTRLVPMSELNFARFDSVLPDYNNEDAHGQNQSVGSKMLAGVTKGLILTGTTFVQSTVGLVNGLAEWNKTGKFSSFYDNDFNRNLDEINKASEDAFANYYTDKERAAHWYSPSKIFSANFIWDGIVKNMGFAAGAYLSGNVFAGGLNMIGTGLTKGAMLANLPKVAKLFSVGKGMEVLQATESAMLAGQATEVGTGIAKLGNQFLGGYNNLNKAQRVIVSGLSTTGEAGFEAFHNMNEYRDKKIAEYISKTGSEPIGKDLEKINKDAEAVGNASFLANAAVLTVTNYIQFPKIAGSTYKAEKTIVDNITKNIDDIVKVEGKFTVKQAQSKVGKTLEFLNKKVRPLTFSTTEGLEEGLQFSVTKGTQDYYDKKDKNIPNSAIQSALYGLKETFTTDEGMENVLIGGISGAMMTARGKISDNINKSANTKDFISKVNKEEYQLPSFLKDTKDAIKRGVALQQEREALLINGDKLGSKSKEADYLINYLIPRIKYGRMDLVNSDIDEYTSLASSDVGFKSLIDEGKVLPGDTREAYLNRLNEFKAVAKDMANLYESLNIRYSTKKDSKGKRLYTDSVIEKMMYSASKVDDYSRRINKLSSDIPTGDVDILGIMKEVINGDDALYNSAIVSINNDDTLTPEKKIDALEALEDLAKMSLYRDMHTKEYLAFRDDPVIHQEEKVETPTVNAKGEIVDNNGKVVSGESITVATSKGKTNFKTNQEYFASSIIDMKDTDGKELTPIYKFTVLGTNEDGTIKIKDHTGERDITVEHFEKINPKSSAITKSNPAAKFYLANIGRTFYYNLGTKKGGKVEGRLRFNGEKDILYFDYINSKGKLISKEVNGKMYDPQPGFKEGVVTFGEAPNLEQQKSLEELQEAENANKVVKIADRRKTVANLIIEATEKKEKSAKLIEQKLATLEKKKTELEEAFSISEEKTPAGNLTKKAKVAKKTIDTLNTTVAQLEREIDTLNDELVETDFTIAQAESIKANIEETSGSDTAFIEELVNEINDLKDLREATEKQISLTESLLKEVRLALDKAKNLLKNILDKLFEKYPTVPFVNIFDENLVYDEDQVDDILNEFAIFPEEAPTRESIQALAQSKWADKLTEYLGSLNDKLDSLSKEIVAKGIILERFQNAINIAAQQAEEFEKAVKSGALSNEIKSTMSTSVNTTEAHTGFEQEQKKSDMNIVLGGLAPTGLNNKEVNTYAARAQKLGFILNKMLASNKKVKARRVTLKTEESLGLKGLMKSMYPNGTEEDHENMIAIVIYDGKGRLLDETGKIIPKGSPDTLERVIAQAAPSIGLTQVYIDSDGNKKESTMFRKDTSPEERVRLQALYAARHAEILASTKPQPLVNVTASFGLPEYVLLKDEKGEVVTNDTGYPLKDYSTRTSAKSAGLVTDSDLKNTNVIMISTNDNKISVGTTSFASKKGSVYLKTLGGIAKLYNRKFNQKEAVVIADVLEEIATRIFRDGNAKEPETVQMFEWLKSVIYWGIAREKQTGKQKPPGGSNVWFETDKDTKEMTLYFGKDRVAFPFTPTGVRDNKSLIVEQLLEMYGNTNTPKATKSGAESYRQITGIGADGKIETVKWQNYQSFLLADKNPDGSERDGSEIPLTTVFRPLDNAEDVNRVGIYFITEDDSNYYERIDNETETETEDDIETKSAIKLNEKKGDIVMDNSTINFVEIADNIEEIGYSISEEILFSLLDKMGVASLKPNTAEFFSLLEALTANKGFKLSISKEQLDDVKKLMASRGFASDLPSDINYMAANYTLEKIAPLLIGKYITSQTTEPKASPKAAPKSQDKPANELFDLSGGKNKTTLKITENGKVVDVPLEFSINFTELQKDLDEDATISTDPGRKIEYALEQFNNKNISVATTKEGKATLSKAFGVPVSDEEFIYAQLAQFVLDTAIKQVESTTKETAPAEIIEVEDKSEAELEAEALLKNRGRRNRPIGNPQEVKRDIPKEINDDDVPFRLAKTNPDAQFDTENWDRIEKNLLKFLPQVALYRVKNLIQATNGMQAYGMFHKAAIYVYESAEEGTAYHEVFEAVWKMFVTVPEKNAILKEFRGRPGSFKEHNTGISIKFSEATDAELKEEMAEEFKRTILEQNKPEPKTLIGKLFRDIINYIKNFVTGKNALVNTKILFDNIGRGVYAKQVIPGETQLALANRGIIDINNASGNIDAEFNLSGIAPLQKHELLQQMTYSAYLYMHRLSKDFFMTTNNKVNAKEMYDAIKKEIFVESVDSTGAPIDGIIMEKIMSIEDEMLNKTISQELGTKRIADLNNFFVKAYAQWDAIVEDHKAIMGTFQVEFDESGDSIEDNENKSKGDDAHDSNKIDAYRKVNSIVKLMFSTLADTQVINGKVQVKRSTIGGVTFVDAPRVYLTMINLLHTSPNVDVMLNRLAELARVNVTYKAAYRRLTGEVPTSEGDISLNTNNINQNGARMLTGMWNAFKKANPEVLTVFLQENGEVSIGNTNLTSISRQSRYTMQQSIINSIKEGNKYFSYDAKKETYSPKQSLLDLIEDTTFGKNYTDYIKFLKTFGITFTGNIPPSQQHKFSVATQGLMKSLASMKNVVSFSSKVLDASNQLLKLGEIDAIIKSTPKNGDPLGPMFESTFYNIDGDKIQTFIGTNLASTMHDLISESTNIEDLANTDLRYLTTDVFSKNFTDESGYVVSNSLLINSIYDAETGDKIPDTDHILKPVYISGTIDMAENDRIPSEFLTPAQRLAQNMNLILEGVYPNLVPGDAGLEHYLRLHDKNAPFVSSTGVLEREYDEIFKNYFIAEVALASDNRIVASKRDEKDLRFFKDIFSSDLGLHDAIIKEIKTKSAEEVYNGEYAVRIKKAIDSFIDTTSEETKKELFTYGLIKKSGTEFTTSLAFSDKVMTEKSLDLEIKKLSLNYMISTIELHKVLYSDPYLYNDELKRIKNFLSPKVPLANSEEVNKVIHKTFNEGFTENDLGYYNFLQDHFKTSVISDVDALIPDLDNYKDTKDSWKETDGGGYITLKAYRAFKIKASAWSGNDEKQYRHDIKYEEIAKRLIAATVANKPAIQRELDAHEKNNPAVSTTYTPIKPIVAGNKANGRNYNDLMLDKYALVPISYRIFHKLNSDSNMIKLYDKMSNENIDYVVYESGRKVGVEKIYPLYVDGKFNDAPFETPEDSLILEENPSLPTMVVNVPFSILSLQSEVPSKDIAKTAQGTQITKLVVMDFRDAGIPIDFMPSEGNFDNRFIAWLKLSDEQRREQSPLFKLIEHNRTILEAKIENGYENLLKLLGIEQTDGGFIIQNKDKMIKTLETELYKQDININIIQTLNDLKSDVILIEASPAYKQIRNVLYSIANSNVTRTKISGGTKVQAPSTLLESGERIVAATSKSGKKYYTSNVLKFYSKGETKEDGSVSKTASAEVMIGRWFNSPLTDEELLDLWYTKGEDGKRTDILTEEGKKALAGVAFRIPTQKQNSIEVFVIKGFLPREYGDSVVVPSGIVQKAGSDFDIDKLSMYFKNLYTNKRGELKVVPFYGIDEVAKNRFKEELKAELQEQTDAKIKEKTSLLRGTENLRDVYNKIVNGTASDALDKKWTPILHSLFEKKIGDNISVEDIETLFDDMVDSLGKSITRLSEQEQLDYVLDRYADTMFTKSLENEYISSLEDLISHPSNFENLVKPNSAKVMKDLAEEINTKKDVPAVDYLSPGFMLSLVKMNRLRGDFIGGKRGIGIAATAQTNNALNQATAIIINPDNITDGTVTEEDKEWLGDGILKFEEFNKLNYNGKEVATLSKKLNAAGEYISDIIGMFIDGYVDISKGAWIMELGAKPSVAGTWLFLIKAGVPVKSVAYFMNQPIVDDYLTSLENEGKKWLFNPWAIKEIKNEYKSTSKEIYTTLPSEDSLSEMVGNRNLSEDQKKQQIFIFNEFLKYSKMAEHLLHVQQGTNLDTATLNDPFLYLKKSEDFKKAQSTILSGLKYDSETDTLIPETGADAVLSNSFIGVLKDVLLDIREAFSEILLTDKATTRQVLERVLLPYTKKSEKEFIKISQRAVTDFFDWAVQTNSDFNKSLRDILLGTVLEKSAAEQIIALKDSVINDLNHPLYGNLILQNIVMDSGSKKNSPKNLKILELGNRIHEQNLIINSFEEIKNYLKETNRLPLYEKLVSLSLLQSGLTASPISFSALLPYEDFKDRYYSVINSLDTIPNLMMYADTLQFERNSFANKEVVPVIKKMTRTNFMTGQPVTPTVDDLPSNLRNAAAVAKIPRVITLKASDINAQEVILYTWTERLKNDEERKRRIREGDTSHFKKVLMRKVYVDKANNMPLVTAVANYGDKPTKHFIYVAINAYGDSFRAKEFYKPMAITNGEESVITMPMSIFDNGISKIGYSYDSTGKKISSGEVSDDAIYALMDPSIKINVPLTPRASRTIAIIGTAGRSKVPTLAEWNNMVEDASTKVRKKDTLISGGAAFADHIAVRLFLDGKVKALKLKLPAPIKKGRFVGERGTAGGTANYYHDIFSKVLGVNTVAQIEAAIKKGATFTVEKEIGNRAMFDRNRKVARESNAMIAYTYGENATPDDGGTGDTWSKAKYADKTHVNISKIAKFVSPTDDDINDPFEGKLPTKKDKNNCK